MKHVNDKQKQIEYKIAQQHEDEIRKAMADLELFKLQADLAYLKLENKIQGGGA